MAYKELPILAKLFQKRCTFTGYGSKEIKEVC